LKSKDHREKKRPRGGPYYGKHGLEQVLDKRPTGTKSVIGAISEAEGALK